MADNPLMKNWEAPDGTIYEVCDEEARKANIPTGGKTGQVLTKKSDEDYDVEWADVTIPKEYGLVTYDDRRIITIT